MTAPTLHRRMTSMDAGFLYFEKPSQPLHIGSTSVLEGPISRDEAIAHMKGRMHRIPRYRELAVFDRFNLGHPTWEADPNFEVERHIEEVVIPKGATQAQAFQTIADNFAPMLPRDRPLWKMVLVHGMPGGKTGLMSLVHHCMVDGVSGIELLNAVTDLAPDAEVASGELPPAPPPQDMGSRLSDAFFEMLRTNMDANAEALRQALDPAQQMRDLQTVTRAMMTAAPSLLQPAPPTHFNRPVGAARSYAVAEMSFSEIRGVRATLGGTINDVVLTTLAGGLGSYLRNSGVNTTGLELRAMVPVNVRSESDKAALGNQVSMLIARLPVGIEDAATRHAAILSSMGQLKSANQAGGFALLTRLADQIPPALQAMAGSFVPNGQTIFNLVCTNVPGPQIPLYIAGRKIEALLPIVPLSSGLGLNTCLTSYNGVLYWGICADPALVSNVQDVADCLDAAFDDLKVAAMASA